MKLKFVTIIGPKVGPASTPENSKDTILEGRCHKGLYPLPLASIKQVFSVDKPSLWRWHDRLGHPSLPIVIRVISGNSLPCLAESNKESVYDACQQAKSYQLRYPRSSSVSSHPLELIFSDVWGPTPSSVGGNKYYVSFIDDYSKFTWVYLLSSNLMCFRDFMSSKILSKDSLTEKLFLCKLIEVESIKNFIPSLKKSA